MKLTRWIPAVAVAALAAVATPTHAQGCRSAFTTCGAMAPMTMSQADIDALTRQAAELAAATAANNGCPAPNGENGAESVLEHNPNCANSNDAGEAAVAPEPGTLMLFGSALMALGVAVVPRRRKRP